MIIEKKRCKRKSKQRQKQKLRAALVAKLFNGAHRGDDALVEIQIFDFFILIFLYFSLILYH
jgi:hypothetical protein